MKKLALTTIALTAVVGFTASNVLALNITIEDNNTSNSNTWYGAGEDQEVEPGMVIGQDWDLEAFILDENSLSLSVIGGYDFKNGVLSGNNRYLHGDIFIATVEEPVFGDIHLDTENQTVSNSFLYDYVLDLKFDFTNNTTTYDVVALTTSSQVSTTSHEVNQGSNPWRYVSGGTILESGGTTLENQIFTYTPGLANDSQGYGLIGGPHNMISGLDLSFLIPGQDFWVHTTMECGNDNLMGYIDSETLPPPPNAVPEPATMLLFGTGLIGLAGVARRRKNKK